MDSSAIRMRTGELHSQIAYVSAVYCCLALLLCLTLIACSKKEASDGADTTKTTAVVPVRAVTIITGNVPERLDVTGHTEAIAREKLVAPIAGKLITLLGIEGMSVEAGEPLATIQSKEAQASEEGAQVMLAEAKTEAERAEAERMVQLAKKDQNGVVVRSRIAGLIASRSANPGEFVTENQELLSIINDGDVAFVADVPLFQMPNIRIGEPAEISLPTLGVDASPLVASVFAIKPQADSASQTGKVVFQFHHVPAPLARAMRTGIAGTARITFDVKHQVMLVPKSAVVRNDETNERTVMTFGADSIAHNVDVTVGPALDSMLSIESNILKPGMNVIVEGNYALEDSTRITLTTSPPSAETNDHSEGTLK